MAVLLYPSLLCEEFIFDEYQVLVDVEHVWFLPGCTRVDLEFRALGVQRIKDDQADPEYPGQGIQAGDVVFRRAVGNRDVRFVREEFV